MACKLKCGSCGKVLKIMDDHSKDAQGEYTYFNGVVECQLCGHKRNSAMEFEGDFI